MNRRLFVRALAAAVLGSLSGAALAEAPPDDAVALVRTLYVREVARHAAGGRIGEEEFLAIFTRAVRELWLAPRSSTANIPVGPILNAFFGWGILPAVMVTLDGVAAGIDPTGALVVTVTLTARGEARHVFVHVAREDGAWRVANIAYDHGEDFVAFRRRLSGR